LPDFIFCARNPPNITISLIQRKNISGDRLFNLRRIALNLSKSRKKRHKKALYKYTGPERTSLPPGNVFIHTRAPDKQIMPGTIFGIFLVNVANAAHTWCSLRETFLQHNRNLHNIQMAHNLLNPESIAITFGLAHGSSYPDAFFPNTRYHGRHEKVNPLKGGGTKPLV
jgi:hypothetical protein